MNKKNQKLLYSLATDCRISTTVLAKELQISQQAASYQKRKLEKDKTITEFASIIDPALINHLSVIVGFSLKKVNFQTKKKVLDTLKHEESIIWIEECSLGIDFIVEYCCPNLSAFNKENAEILKKLSKEIKQEFILPEIVKHIYTKDYLTRKPRNDGIVIQGDREPLKFSDKEIQILELLRKYPAEPLIYIAKKAKMSVATIMNTKKNLQRKRVIRQYISIFNNQKLGIKRNIIFLSFSGDQEMNKVQAVCDANRNVIEYVKVIGQYQAYVVFESIKEEEDVIKQLRTELDIENYMLIISEEIHKKQFIPILPS